MAGFYKSIRGGPSVGVIRWTDGCAGSQEVREWIVSLKRGSR